MIRPLAYQLYSGNLHRDFAQLRLDLLLGLHPGHSVHRLTPDNKIIVGIAVMPCSTVIFRLASVSTLPTLTLPLNSVANSSMSGEHTAWATPLSPEINQHGLV